MESDITSAGFHWSHPKNGPIQKNGAGATKKRSVPGKRRFVTRSPCVPGPAAGDLQAERQNAQIVIPQPVSQSGGHTPAQRVTRETQRLEPEVPQLPRYPHAEPIGGEVQFNDAAIVVVGDPMPFANWLVAQPVIIVIPIGPAGGVVEGGQRFPVFFRRSLRQRGPGCGPFHCGGGPFLTSGK